MALGSSSVKVLKAYAFRNIMRDRAAQIQENEQNARNDQAPSAPGRFSLFRIWLSCKGAHYVAFAISWSYQMMIVAV